MKNWQWGQIMFGLIMICYYLTDKQEVSLVPCAFFFAILGVALSVPDWIKKK